MMYFDPYTGRIRVAYGPGDKTKRLRLKRPRNRMECKVIPRPCPFVSCRYNMYAEVMNKGHLKILFPECKDPSEMPHTNCVLDIVEKEGEMKINVIAIHTGIAREKIRKTLASAISKIKPILRQLRD